MKWMSVAAVAAALIIGAVTAGSGSAALPDDREATMKHIKRALRPLAEMIRGGTFDATEAGTRGQEIAGYLQQFKDLFPAGSEKADDKAGPKIWTDRSGFEAARSDAYEAALGLSKVTDADSFRVAYKTLSAACSACHDKYARLK